MTEYLADGNSTRKKEREVAHSQGVIPAGDNRLRKRLDTYQFGEPEHLFTCRWGRKDAVVALTKGHVILVSLSPLGGIVPAKLDFAQVLAGDDGHCTLALYGDRENLELPSAAQAELMTATINDASAKLKAAKAATAAEQRTFALRPEERMVSRCKYAGGAHLPLVPGADLDLIFRTNQLEVYPHPARFGDQPAAVLEYAHRFDLELGGPGAVQSGGGFIGGGFGAAGAVEGMAVATVLNALTTRQKIVTVIRVADSGHEGFFVNTSMTPEDLRRNLSPVFVALREHAARDAQRPGASTEDDLTGKLERVAALHAAGSLTDEEFAAAKRALLG